MNENTSIDFRFPFTPYPTQQCFMTNLYKTLEDGKIGLFESPTGTGKTLSLLCGSLAWLHNTSKLPDEFTRDKTPAQPNKLKEELNVPSWLLDETDEDFFLKEKRENQEFQLRKLKERLVRYEKDKIKRLFPTMSTMSTMSTTSQPTTLPSKKLHIDNNDDDNDDDLLFDTILSNDQLDEEAPISITKIYYCSRTHSQLNQVLHEFLHSSWSQDMHCCILGGRRTFCINNSVKRLPTDSQMSDQCLFLQRNRNRGKSGCPFHQKEKELNVSNEILLNNMDIEDLLKTSQANEGCPYYASRRSIPFIELVLLPYNLILNSNSRETLGIDIKNQIIIFDEAHNLINTISDIYSPRITKSMLASSLSQLKAYYTKYSTRLASQSHSFIIHLTSIFQSLIDLLTIKSTGIPIVTVHKTDQFILRLHLDNINLFDILRFIREKRIVNKLNGFVDKLNNNETPAVSYFPAVLDFISSLTSEDDDTRIVVNYDNQDPFVQLLLLNPASHFQPIVKDARSVIVTGGTLQPFEELKNQLFTTVPSSQITSISFPHVISSQHVQSLFITKKQGRDFLFNYASRSNRQMLTDLIDELSLICDHVPRGFVVFFPSFSLLESVVHHIHLTQKWTLINEKKRLFIEERGKDIFKEYADYLNANVESTGALLFAVIGGKLSEGINFSDDLGRCVAVVGMPYPNQNDVILQEKMKYLDNQKAGLGNEYYHNLCIKAVNQAIGRAFRHKDDWASVLFLDCRYNQSTIRKRLTSWIEERGQVCTQDQDVINALDSFYKQFHLYVCLNKNRIEFLFSMKAIQHLILLYQVEAFLI